MKYECIKNAHMRSGLLCGQGYALAPFENLEGCGLEFSFQLREICDVSFVFGFRGVGHHYRCRISPKRNLVILYLIKDGVPVYMQHASIRIKENSNFRVLWAADLVTLFESNTCFINIVGESIESGRWGFAVDGEPIRLPDVTVTQKPRTQNRWIVLGDGYSNNRWQNRHFFSWPELAFGHRGDYLNACVAAGNTRRVLEMIEQIQTRFAGSDAIIAAGADDFIEGTPMDESTERIREIIARLKVLGAKHIHVCAIPPRARLDEEVVRRNVVLKSLALKEADGFIDFHNMLSSRKEKVLVNGDYPGETAQTIMAQGVISYLGLSNDLAPLVAVERTPKIRGFAARIARQVLTRLEAGLDRLPTAGVS